MYANLPGVTNLEKQFSRMGARLTVSERLIGFSVDVLRDRGGGRFHVVLDGGVTQVGAVDVQPRQRHLLLVVQGLETHKFLCGHDERDWFAAAIPTSGVSTVKGAMDALRPAEVRLALARQHVRRQRWNRRRNAAFVRQGEWFFIPEPNLTVDPFIVLRNEPISRGRGQAHWVELLCRSGGEVVYVNHEHPQGLSAAEYRRLIAADPAKRRNGWRQMQRNPQVYARGKVRHPDHKTIFLDGWHRVLMNTESEASSMRHLAFLD